MDDETKIYQTFIYAEVPALILIIVNMYLTFKMHGGNLFEGKWNSIITLFILLTIIASIIFTCIIISLDDTTGDIASAFITMGAILPSIFLVIYLIIIALRWFKHKGAPPAGGTVVVANPITTPHAGGGRRRNRRRSGK